MCNLHMQEVIIVWPKCQPKLVFPGHTYTLFGWKMASIQLLFQFWLHYKLVIWLASVHPSILLLLIIVIMFSSPSEEVFDFSSGQMTQTKTLVMKDTMCHEFSKVFQLCIFVLVRDIFVLMKVVYVCVCVCVCSGKGHICSVNECLC